MSESDAHSRSTFSSPNLASLQLFEEGVTAIAGSPDTSVSSSTPAVTSLNSPPSDNPTLPDTSETEVTSTSCSENNSWNLGSIDTGLGDKNPLSVISEEDMIKLQSVLLTEEGKKILQQTSLTDMEAEPSGSSKDVPSENKTDDGLYIPLELDDETASQILKEGIRESYLVDFAVNFSDHAYSASNAGNTITESSAVPIDSPKAATSETEESTSESPNVKKRGNIRRSTRIQDQEQREMAEKIRQENIQAEKEALSQEEEPKADGKKYNMRTQRPQRDDGRVDYTARRGRKKMILSAEMEDADTDNPDGSGAPRRSSRSPKKKAWLLELERERDSKGEDSGRESVKDNTQNDDSMDDSDDDGNDLKSHSELDVASDHDLSFESEMRVDENLGVPAVRGIPRRRGRGGKGTGRGKKLINMDSMASSGSDNESNSSQAAMPSRGRGRRGGRGGKGKKMDGEASRGKAIRGGKSVRGRKNIGKTLNVSVDSDMEHSTEADDPSSGKTKGKRAQAKSAGRGKNSPAQTYDKTTAGASESESSEDDLPLTVIKKITHENDVEEGIIDSEEPSTSLKMKTVPSDREPILQSMYGEAKKQKRRVRGHKEQEDDEMMMVSELEAEDVDSADTEWGSEDDPERLWCICRKPFNNRFMISCDLCNQWYHGSCVGVTRKQGKEIARLQENWSCPVCLKGQKKKNRNGSISVDTKEEDIKSSENFEGVSADVKLSPIQKPRKSINKPHHEDVEEGEPVDGQENDEGQAHNDDEGHGDNQGQDVDSLDMNKSQGHVEDKDEGQINEQDHKEYIETEQAESDPWTVRKKDSEKKLEAMQEKLKALQAKKDKKSEDPKREGKSDKKERRDEKYKSSKDHKPQSLKDRCLYMGCPQSVMPGSIYCSEDCIAKYAAESVSLLKEERERNYGSRSSEGSTERVVVMERKTGKIVTGPAAPTESTLRAWLEKHPSFEVLRPEKHAPKKKEEKRKSDTQKRETSSKEKPLKHSDVQSLEKQSRERERKERKERERQKRREQAVKQFEEKPPPTSSAPNPVRIGVRKALKDYLTNRMNDVDDVLLSNSEIKKVALDIEEHLFQHYNEVGVKYKHKFKHILLNIKDVKNKGLFRKILHSDITPYELVRMSSDILASKEVAHWQERDAAAELELLGVDESPMKSSGSPQSPLSSPTTPVSSLSRIPKKVVTSEESKPRTDSGSDFFSSFMFDTTAQHRNHLFDVNCKICTGKVSLTEEESVPDKKVKFSGTAQARLIPGNETKTVADEGINDHNKPIEIQYDPVDMEVDDSNNEMQDNTASSVFNYDLMGSEDDVKPKHTSLSTVSQERKPLIPNITKTTTSSADSSSTMDKQPSLEKPYVPVSTKVTVSNITKPVTADPRLSKSGAIAGSPQLVKPKPRYAPSPPGSSSIWKGHLFAQDLAKFATSAYVISGSGSGIREDLPETIAIMGRLPPENVFEYLGRLKLTHASNREISVLKFVPTLDDDKNHYLQLYNYLNGRNRCGVVGAMGRVIKDLYIVPLPAHSQVPKVLMPFDGPGLEFPRPHLLLCIIVKTKTKKPPQKETTKDPQSSRTWMYSERPPGEVKSDESSVQPSGPVKPTKSLTGRQDPRLAAKAQNVPEKSSDSAQVTSSQDTIEEALSPELSSDSEDDNAAMSEAYMNDPIIKQYKKGSSKKLAKELKSAAVEVHKPPEEDVPYDPFTSYDYNDDDTMDEEVSTSTASAPGTTVTSNTTTALTATALPPAVPISSSTPLTGILEELTKTKSASEMTAAMLATLAATSATRTIEEQRNLLLELNKKVEEQRLFLEKQREETLKRRQESIQQTISKQTANVPAVSSSEIKPINVPDMTSFAASLETGTMKEKLTAQQSILDNEIVSTKLNIARRRLAQKIQSDPAVYEPETAPPSTSTTNPGVGTLPPALRSLLSGPSLESLKSIMSSVSKPTVKTNENDDLDLALNDRGGMYSSDGQWFQKLTKPVSQLEPPHAEPKIWQPSSSSSTWNSGNQMASESPVSEPSMTFVDNSSAELSRSSSSAMPPVTSSELQEKPAWLLQIQETLAKLKEAEKAKSPVKVFDSSKDQDVVYIIDNPEDTPSLPMPDKDRSTDRTRELDRGRSRDIRKRDEKPSRTQDDEEMEEGEIRDQPASSNKPGKDDIVISLDDIPLPSDVSAPSRMNESHQLGSDKSDSRSSMDKKVSSPRKSGRSHSQERRRRSRSRNRRNRSRSKSRRGHSRSPSKGYSRRSRRSRSRDRRRRSRDRSYRRSKSKERRPSITKRKRSISKEPAIEVDLKKTRVNPAGDKSKKIELKEVPQAPNFPPPSSLPSNYDQQSIRDLPLPSGVPPASKSLGISTPTSVSAKAPIQLRFPESATVTKPARMERPPTQKDSPDPIKKKRDGTIPEKIAETEKKTSPWRPLPAVETNLKDTDSRHQAAYDPFAAEDSPFAMAKDSSETTTLPNFLPPTIDVKDFDYRKAVSTSEFKPMVPPPPLPLELFGGLTMMHPPTHSHIPERHGQHNQLGMQDKLRFPDPELSERGREPVPKQDNEHNPHFLHEERADPMRRIPSSDDLNKDRSRSSIPDSVQRGPPPRPSHTKISLLGDGPKEMALTDNIQESNKPWDISWNRTMEDRTSKNNSQTSNETGQDKKSNNPFDKLFENNPRFNKYSDPGRLRNPDMPLPSLLGPGPEHMLTENVDLQGEKLSRTTSREHESSNNRLNDSGRFQRERDQRKEDRFARPPNELSRGRDEPRGRDDGSRRREERDTRQRPRVNRWERNSPAEERRAEKTQDSQNFEKKVVAEKKDSKSKHSSETLEKIIGNEKKNEETEAKQISPGISNTKVGVSDKYKKRDLKCDPATEIKDETEQKKIESPKIVAKQGIESDNPIKKADVTVEVKSVENKSLNVIKDDPVEKPLKAAIISQLASDKKVVQLGKPDIADSGKLSKKADPSTISQVKKTTDSKEKPVPVKIDEKESRKPEPIKLEEGSKINSKDSTQKPTNSSKRPARGQDSDHVGPERKHSRRTSSDERISDRRRERSHDRPRSPRNIMSSDRSVDSRGSSRRSERTRPEPKKGSLLGDGPPEREVKPSIRERNRSRERDRASPMDSRYNRDDRRMSRRPFERLPRDHIEGDWTRPEDDVSEGDHRREFRRPWREPEAHLDRHFGAEDVDHRRYSAEHIHEEARPESEWPEQHSEERVLTLDYEHGLGGGDRQDDETGWIDPEHGHRHEDHLWEEHVSYPQEAEWSDEVHDAPRDEFHEEWPSEEATWPERYDERHQRDWDGHEGRAGPPLLPSRGLPRGHRGGPLIPGPDARGRGHRGFPPEHRGRGLPQRGGLPRGGHPDQARGGYRGGPPDHARGGHPRGGPPNRGRGGPPRGGPVDHARGGLPLGGPAEHARGGPPRGGLPRGGPADHARGAPPRGGHRGGLHEHTGYDIVHEESPLLSDDRRHDWPHPEFEEHLEAPVAEPWDERPAGEPWEQRGPPPPRGGPRGRGRGLPPNARGRGRPPFRPMGGRW